jgi:hypothetical protein
MRKLRRKSDAEGKGKKREPMEDLITVDKDFSPHMAEERWELSY